MDLEPTDDPAPARSGDRQHPLRARQDSAHRAGGPHRSRSRGRWFNKKSGPECVPLEAARARQYRFPDTPSTSAQGRALEKIVAKYLRCSHLHRYQEFGVELLARSIGLEKRQTSTLLTEVRMPGRDETVELAKAVFHAMHTGLIAGVLGTRRTDDNRAIFKLIATVSEFDVAPEDRDAFGMWRAAFHLDYREWKVRREPWPFTKSGARRKTRSCASGAAQIG
jgi:hypothetical protein